MKFKIATHSLRALPSLFTPPELPDQIGLLTDYDFLFMFRTQESAKVALISPISNVQGNQTNNCGKSSAAARVRTISNQVVAAESCLVLLQRILKILRGDRCI